MLVKLSEIKLTPIDYLNQDSAMETFFKQCGVKSAEHYYHGDHWSNQTISKMSDDLMRYSSNITKTDYINDTLLKHSERMALLMESYQSISRPSWFEELDTSESIYEKTKSLMSVSMLEGFKPNESAFAIAAGLINEPAVKELYLSDSVSAMAKSLMIAGIPEEHSSSKSIRSIAESLTSASMLESFQSNESAFAIAAGLINEPAVKELYLSNSVSAITESLINEAMSGSFRASESLSSIVERAMGDSMFDSKKSFLELSKENFMLQTFEDHKKDFLHSIGSYREIIDYEFKRPPVTIQEPANIPTYRETKTTTLYARFETMEDKISNIEEHLFVEREIKNEAVKKTFIQSNINDSAFNELFESAKNRYIENDLQVAIENIWAAFERIKTYFYSDKNNIKSNSADTLVKMIAAEFDKDFFDREFKELTTIGNNYRIRHHERNKHDLSEKHIRYLFLRMLVLLDLCIEVLHEHESTEN